MCNLNVDQQLTGASLDKLMSSSLLMAGGWRLAAALHVPSDTGHVLEQQHRTPGPRAFCHACHNGK